MRKTITTIALIAVLGTMAASCQKESPINQASIVSESCTTYTVQYTIDGVSHTVTLIGEDTWHDFLNRMFALAEEGHVVSFRNVESSPTAISAKETIKHTTTSKEEAYAWGESMGKSGYLVTIEYDKETGVYTCYAIK